MGLSCSCAGSLSVRSTGAPFRPPERVNGYDLGASDYKVAAVIEGKCVFSEEVVWEPGVQSDPDDHYREIISGLRRAASFLPRVDAIGGSAAGIYVDNKVRIASLFRNVPSERYDAVRDLFLRIRNEMGVPRWRLSTTAKSRHLLDRSPCMITEFSALRSDRVRPGDM
ncbi:hypothetical protein LM597_04605 [Candidatus Acetothermia bacterium]|nr:hypothetical protein [Candidatus Acetothermia bacterium]